MRKFTLIIVTLAVNCSIAFSQGCLPEGITFFLQSQINSFQANYPGCTEIEGSVRIDGENITNLNGLNVLTAVNGDLSIENTNISSLEGLENLTSVGVDLWIHNNALSDLTGFDNLTTIGGSFYLTGNFLLESLIGLNNLQSVGGNLLIGAYIYSGNPLLKNLQGLNSMTYVGGLEICFNDSLNSLEGLENLSFVNEDFEIFNNASLENLAGLVGLKTINGSLIIGSEGWENTTLTSLIGLDSLTYIGGGLSIKKNTILTNLNGLEALKIVGKNPYTSGSGLSIVENTNLIDLSGLSSLDSIIKGGLDIFRNDNLVSFSGIENLDFLDGNLFVSNNGNLESINGLENLSGGSIQELIIRNNTSLNECDAQAICEFLSAPNGRVEIYNNDDGCSDPVEIANNCGITLPCLPYGYYYFESQEELDNFSVNYPNCSSLNGLSMINGEDIINLDGLNVITSIDGDLIITNNPQLEDIFGLDNADGTLTGLNISFNQLLSDCNLPAVCNFIPPGWGLYEIHDNAPGCNSTEEVDSLCNITDVPNFYNEHKTSIYPNPVNSTLILIGEFALSETVNICIYNTSGICLKSWEFTNQKTGQQEFTLDLSNLPPGIYFLCLQAGNEVVVKKVVKL